MYTMGMTGTKWDIFLAALDLFAREGFHSVSVAQIANAAGIRASSIYNHFPCKDALVEAMYVYYDNCSDRYLPPLETLMEDLGSRHPLDTLRRTILSPDSKTEQIMGQILLVASSMQNDVRAKLLIHKNIFQIPRHYLSELFGRMIAERMIEPFDVDEFLFLYCSVYHSLSMLGAAPHADRDWPNTAAHLFDRYVIMEKGRAAG